MCMTTTIEHFTQWARESPQKRYKALMGLLGNPFDLLACFDEQTIDGNLSRGMRQLNGLYTHKFNNRYKENGHLFQGRYKAIIVQKESYLLELSRYVVLNPVRAKMVALPEDWAWSE